MKPKTLMLLCVAVGCGLVAMIGVQQALNKPKTAEVQTIQVAVALADINPGEPLNEGNVGFQEVPAEGAREDSVTKPEEYAQRSLKVALVAGDFITKAKLNEKGVIGKSAQIPLGSRIFTINVDETQSASNMLNPGDKVDVHVTFDARTPAGMVTKSVTLLERVDVFAVQDKTKGDRQTSGDNSKVNARQISLVVTPDETTLLALAQRKGQLGLVWRNPLDKTVNTSKSHTEQVLAELRGKDQDARPEVGGEQPSEKPTTAEVKPAAPDLSSFLDATKTAIASLPKPAPSATPVAVKPASEVWEVKIYKGNDIQAYPFELTKEKSKNEPAQKADSKSASPAEAASAASSLLKSFGLSLPSSVGMEPAAAPAGSPTL
jgi:pilus assembly protein CpaB